MPRGYTGSSHTLDISRRALVHAEDGARWVSVYGGKLTGCVGLAKRVVRMLETRAPRHGSTARGGSRSEEPSLIDFPGVPTRIPSPEWCRENESCYRIDDYLRRRTNVAQWVPRGGLGRNDENRTALEALAARLYGDAERARRDVGAYANGIRRSFERALQGLPGRGGPS